ncbi:thioredoxin family protein [Halioxenophilus aromaticivorans]|uniref:Thioredoxin family protein n=1 Tax=Halioxenophilus aromaticivorans TaxID=1306992 RepID=A0AAV3U4B9_9ALTE
MDIDYREDAPSLEQVSATGGLLLLEFGAPWCGHCQAAQPAIAEALASHPVEHLRIADGKGKPLGRSFGVKLWPTLILLSNGQEQARVVRPTSQEDLAALFA